VNIELRCIEVVGRKLLVFNGIAFYCSTGVNTSDIFKDTWFPMLGVGHMRFIGTGIPDVLTTPFEDMKTLIHKNYFEKPTVHIFQNSDLAYSSQQILDQSNTMSMKDLPLFKHLVDDAQSEHQFISELKIYECIIRFFHPRLLAISAALGGGIWTTPYGVLTQENLKLDYPEYFANNLILVQNAFNPNLLSGTVLRARHLIDKTIKEQLYYLQINYWLKDCGAYLFDGCFDSFLSSVENTASFPHETRLSK
jgi:hypothetical protein